MPATPPETLTVTRAQAGATLAAVLRGHRPHHSWSQVRRLIAGRRVRIGGDLCLDPARRLKEGELLELLDRPIPEARSQEAIVIRFLDRHLVVVEKPSGLSTVRHPAERRLSSRRKSLAPTLEDLVPGLIAQREGRDRKKALPHLRIVQRLDKETSGLVVLVRSVDAERHLGRQFRQHTVIRRYLAIVPGHLKGRRIATFLVRDRGDGRRGSTSVKGLGKEAITHVEVVERLRGYTVLACRLETGRTHQIRIHLAEAGHPVCGDKVYSRRAGLPPEPDKSGAPRLALHAAELGFVHPVSGRTLHWTMPWPTDLQTFLERLRGVSDTIPPVARAASSPLVATGGLPRPEEKRDQEPDHPKQFLMEIKWTDLDPETGQRRFLCAEKFAGEWAFRWKLQRRGPWTRGLQPTLAMWEHVLDSLQRRYRRREGVSDEDVAQVERILADRRRRHDEEE